MSFSGRKSQQQVALRQAMGTKIESDNRKPYHGSGEGEGDRRLLSTARIALHCSSRLKRCEGCKIVTRNKAWRMASVCRVSDGRALVSDIRADGPSSDLGLAVGDELQSVDGQQIDASRFDHVAVLIRGSEGTQVRLTLRRDGETKEVVATRSVPLSTKVTF
eukprot:762980-Hanusia_phi.AAC.1